MQSVSTYDSCLGLIVHIEVIVPIHYIAESG